MGQTCYYMALNWYAMRIDFLVEGFAQSDDIAACASRLLQVLRIEPQFHLVKEMESGPVDHALTIRMFIGTEKNGGRKNPLETLDESVVVITIWGKLEEIEHLGSSFKLHCATLLPQCQGCNPDRNQAILAKRQSVLRVADDLEKKFSTMPGVCQLIAGWLPQRDSAENERPRVIGKFLLPDFTLVSNKLDGIELFDAASCDTYGGKQ